MTGRVLNGPENYDPARTRPSRAPALFPHTLVIICSGVRSASDPSREAGSQTYCSPHVTSNDSQQTIFNLQLARIVFYKKGSLRPDPTWLICIFFSA